MQPVLTVAEMRAVDARALGATPLEVLVERAGTAVAVAALDLLGGAYGRRVVLICGKGSNGADGRVAARLLAGRGARVQVVAPGELGSIGDTGPGVDLVVDAAFGTGFRGTYDAPVVTGDVPVLAVDIPSGVDGDTGHTLGRVLPATRTVTFVAAKPGLLQWDGVRVAGQVSVVDIGLPVGDHGVDLVEDADAVRMLAPRRSDGHKWDAAVAVVAGSPGMTGAAELCARAAYRAGSGMVRLGVPGCDPALLPPSEAVGVELPADGWSLAALEATERCRSLVVGPGLARRPGTDHEVRQLVARSPVPVVVDADGLVALGRIDGTLDATSAVVLTPHDGEFERLAGSAPGPDRIAAARHLAAAAGAVVLLKGPTTVVAEPSGRVLVSTAGTPSLATAGTGDVLAGVIAAFLARGVPPAAAAALGAHVHGRAGRMRREPGLLAGDLPDLVARELEILGVPV